MGGVTVYARKYKLKYFSHHFDNEIYSGYNVLPNIDLSKAKNLKIIISNGFQKYAGTISDDDFYDGLSNSVDGFELHVKGQYANITTSFIPIYIYDPKHNMNNDMGLVNSDNNYIIDSIQILN